MLETVMRFGFSNVSDKIHVPINNFDDYLGKGFSGDVEKEKRIELVFYFRF
jgi:hypothetical protein